MRIFLVALSVLMMLLSNVFAQETTHSGQAATESVRASGHASGSAAHSIAASGRVTSAAIAVPMSVGGAVLVVSGAASVSAANQSMRAAIAPIGTPLPITDEAIVTTPPNVALKR
ncbi:MAG: hypothetical protein WCL27_17565 [Betaproteobacteria bacterium]